MIDAPDAVKADVRARVERVQAQMRERGAGGLIIYYGGQHNMLRTDQLFYLTDFRSLGPAVLLVPAQGRTTLVLTPPWDLARAKEAAGVEEAVAVAPDALLATAAEHAKALPAPLVLSGRGIMPIAAWRTFVAALGSEPADGETIVTSLVSTRTPVELARIQEAAHLADLGFDTLRRVARVGMREYELAAEVEAAMHAAGAEDNFGLIAAGAHNVAIRPPTDRKLERGDVIIGEITPCVRGYLAQLCRTFILGEPTPEQRTTFALLVAAEEAGFKAATPGAPSAGIAKAVNEVIAAKGYGEYCKPPYMRTRGHGLGLGGVVPYDVTEDSGPVLERNMTMVIHPNQYVPETGYMMCGDTVVIEDDGPRRLTETPIELYWLAD
jgi:Xaa-Pro aminopeptidase